MVRLAEVEQPALIIVGPELPLSLGIVDELQQRGFRVFGPTRQAAMLESSKGFAKRFMQRHNIPTAKYAVCLNLAEAEKSIDIFHAPIVVKADGLAAGKGVLICQSRNEALDAARDLFAGSLLGTPGASDHRGRIPGRRGDQLPLPERRKERCSAVCRAGSQAHWRRRHWAKHRRHGRLLHR